MTRVKVVSMVLGVALAVPLVSANADEAKAPISASMLLSITSPRVESREAAYDESLKDPVPPAPPRSGEILPDGSVRYGSTVVTVKNPCPPGTVHYEPPPLPGRRSRTVRN